jgi:hypothetical protein
LYDNAADRAPDTRKPTLQLTETAGSEEPESLHNIEDSATQRDISHVVRPAFSPSLYPRLPNPLPVTVRLLPPVDAALVDPTQLKLGAEKLTPTLKLPVCRIADKTACTGLPTPRDTRHATTLSAAHAELVDADPPIRLVALSPNTPIERPQISTNEAPDAATSSKLTDETLTAL